VRADITHLHFPYPVGELSQLVMGGRRPFVITYHSDVVRQQRVLQLYRPLLHRLLQRAASILVTSPNYLATSPFLGPVAERCAIVPLGIDPAPFVHLPVVRPAEAANRLLFIGRHRYYKGVDDLLRALPATGATLEVGGDGPMRPAWERLSQELHLSGRVHFSGELADAEMAAAYGRAAVFVLPANARAEAFGLVLLEAMAAGLPCITTELGTGTSYVVEDGVTGRVIPPRQPVALAAAIAELLGDEKRRHAMGQAARARVLANFTLATMIERVEAVYERVLAQGPL
jgi:rhamnosyl/mannosyltransferase